MFEKIFGSDEKNETVQKLEKIKQENEKIREKLEQKEKKLEKEKKRAKEAITKKQETDKELKEAKHRIESLEDRIKNLESEKEEKEKQKKVKFLTRTDTLSLIKELESMKSEKESMVTHYIENLDEVNKREKSAVLRNIDSQTGYIYIKDRFELIKMVIIPPIPIDSDFYRNRNFRLEKIENALNTDEKIGFVSAHAGKSMIGTIMEAEFSEFEIIKNQVKGKHSKGGFSQGRFERGRKEQIQKHVKEIVKNINESMKDVDYLILDGNKKIISEIEEDVSIEAPKISRSLDISKIAPEDRKKYIEKVLGSRIYVLCS